MNKTISMRLGVSFNDYIQESLLKEPELYQQYAQEFKFFGHECDNKTALLFQIKLNCSEIWYT